MLLREWAGGSAQPEWSVADDRFEEWAAEFRTPDSISPAWHFVKEIILRPTAK